MALRSLANEEELSNGNIWALFQTKIIDLPWVQSTQHQPNKTENTQLPRRIIHCSIHMRRQETRKESGAATGAELLRELGCTNRVRVEQVQNYYIILNFCLLNTSASEIVKTTVKSKQKPKQHRKLGRHCIKVLNCFLWRNKNVFFGSGDRGHQDRRHKKQ